jgi:hypothetical protein
VWDGVPRGRYRKTNLTNGGPMTSVSVVEEFGRFDMGPNLPLSSAYVHSSEREKTHPTTWAPAFFERSWIVPSVRCTAPFVCPVARARTRMGRTVTMISPSAALLRPSAASSSVMSVSTGKEGMTLGTHR